MFGMPFYVIVSNTIQCPCIIVELFKCPTDRQTDRPTLVYTMSLWVPVLLFWPRVSWRALARGLLFTLLPAAPKWATSLLA